MSPVTADRVVCAVEAAAGCIECDLPGDLLKHATFEGGGGVDGLAPPMMERVAGEREAVDSLAKEGVDASLQAHRLCDTALNGCSCAKLHIHVAEYQLAQYNKRNTEQSCEVMHTW